MAALQYMSPISVIVQYLTNLGFMAQGGTLTTYLAGTATPQATSPDSTGIASNPNPMTLSSTGRPVSVSGAPVAFWTASGVALKLIVLDAGGNQLVYLDNIPAINDPGTTSSLQTALANPASGSGVDLVANAVKSYAVVANVRTANIPALAAGQTLIVDVEGGTSVGDGLGGSFYWSAAATGTDNGTSIINPTGNLGNGRYLRLSNPPFGALASIASAGTTDLGTLATNIVTITGTTTITSLGSSASLSRPLYVVNFAAALTLTNAGSLVLPGGENILTAANDSCLALYIGSGNWFVLAYFKAALTPDLGSAIATSSAAQSFNTQATLQNDTALTLPLAVGTYLVSMRVLLLGSQAAMGYKTSCVFSGTATFGPFLGVQSVANTANAIWGAAFGATIATVSADFLMQDFTLIVTAPGVLTFQFAQENSNANNISRLAGSTLIAKRVA